MHTHPLFARVAALAVLASAVTPAGFAAVKFEEQVVVPGVQQAQVVVSPRGVHTAAVIPKGSRQVVVVDGVEGPRFDSIYAPTLFTFKGVGGKAQQFNQPRDGNLFGASVSGYGGSGAKVFFTPDGNHHAYVARAGPEWVVVSDGKEIFRGANMNISWIAFAPGTQKLVFFMATDDGTQRVVIDGQPGPVSAQVSSDVFFTADGAHYAYVGQQPGINQPQWMVADGRQVKYLGNIQGLAPNGLVLSTLQTNGQTVLLGSGKPMTAIGGLNHFNISPQTGRLVMQVKPTLGTPPQAKSSVITVDGQILPGTENITVKNSYFSPDGKHYAIHCQRVQGVMEQFMIVDGKKELSYTNIFDSPPYVPSFSPDSTKFCYVAQSASGQFVVVNGEESDSMQVFHTQPVWSPVGSRHVWGGTSASGKSVLSIDGKLTAIANNQQPGPSLQFTPDGAHLFWGNGTPTRITLVVDGNPIPGVGGLGIVGTEAVDGQYATLKLSPDGKHAAYPAVDAANPARRGLWVDGKLVTTTNNPQVNRLTFSPDSQHVAWAVIGVKDNLGAYRVFVDGQEVFTYSSTMADNTPGAWTWGEDGALTILGMDNGDLKRYRIPAPTDTNITAMLAAVKN